MFRHDTYIGLLRLLSRDLWANAILELSYGEELLYRDREEAEREFFARNAACLRIPRAFNGRDIEALDTEPLVRAQKADYTLIHEWFTSYSDCYGPQAACLNRLLTEAEWATEFHPPHPTRT